MLSIYKSVTIRSCGFQWFNNSYTLHSLQCSHEATNFQIHFKVNAITLNIDIFFLFWGKRLQSYLGLLCLFYFFYQNQSGFQTGDSRINQRFDITIDTGERKKLEQYFVLLIMLSIGFGFGTKAW